MPLNSPSSFSRRRGDGVSADDDDAAASGGVEKGERRQTRRRFVVRLFLERRRRRYGALAIGRRGVAERLSSRDGSTSLSLLLIGRDRGEQRAGSC